MAIAVYEADDRTTMFCTAVAAVLTPEVTLVTAERPATVTDSDPEPDTARPLPTDTAPAAVVVAYGSLEEASKPSEIADASCVWLEGVKLVGMLLRFV